MNSFNRFKILLNLLNAILLLLLMFLTGCQSNPSIDTTGLDNSEPDNEMTEERATTKGTSEDGVEFSKIALVIGNDDYEYSSLSNPIKDAKQVYNSLKKVDFKAQLKTNLTQQEMDEALDEFYEELRDEPGSMGLLYYAGHGAQADNENYLIPIDNKKISKQSDLAYNAIPLSKIQTDMNNAKTYFNVLILDACRDNPYDGKDRSLRRGLAQQTLSTPPKTRGLRKNIGSILAFSTASGEVASDDIGYADHLSKMLSKTNEEATRIDDLFRELTKKIQEKSNGEQTPWYNTSLTDVVYLGERQSKTPPQPPPKPPISKPPIVIDVDYQPEKKKDQSRNDDDSNSIDCRDLLKRWERGFVPLTKKEEKILFNQCSSN